MLHLLRLAYTDSEEAAEPHVAAHVPLLERHHAAGTFLLSGQTVPSSDGGLIIVAKSAAWRPRGAPTRTPSSGRGSPATASPPSSRDALTQPLPPSPAAGASRRRNVGWAIAAAAPTGLNRSHAVPIATPFASVRAEKCVAGATTEVQRVRLAVPPLHAVQLDEESPWRRHLYPRLPKVGPAADVAARRDDIGFGQIDEFSAAFGFPLGDFLFQHPFFGRIRQGGLYVKLDRHALVPGRAASPQRGPVRASLTVRKPGSRPSGWTSRALSPLSGAKRRRGAIVVGDEQVGHPLLIARHRELPDEHHGGAVRGGQRPARVVQPHRLPAQLHDPIADRRCRRTQGHLHPRRKPDVRRPSGLVELRPPALVSVPVHWIGCPSTRSAE